MQFPAECESRRQLWMAYIIFMWMSGFHLHLLLLHRITEQSRLQGTSGFPPSSIQYPLPLTTSYPKTEQVSEGLGQLSFEYLKGWRHHNLSEQPSPAFAHLHNLERKKVLSVQIEFPIFQLVPIASCPVSGHYWGKPGSIFLAPACYPR